MRIYGVSEPSFSPSSDAVAIQAENRKIIRAVHAVNASEKLPTSHELVFSLDRQSRRPIIKVVDRLTNEVVQQIPNEQILRMAEDLKIVGPDR
jgi:flagellar protein FlaG